MNEKKWLNGIQNEIQFELDFLLIITKNEMNKRNKLNINKEINDEMFDNNV